MSNIRKASQMTAGAVAELAKQGNGVHSQTAQALYNTATSGNCGHLGAQIGDKLAKVAPGAAAAVAVAAPAAVTVVAVAGAAYGAYKLYEWLTD